MSVDYHFNSDAELRGFCVRLINGATRFSDHHIDEQVAFARVMPALTLHANIPYPITLIHRDKPDFSVTWKEGVLGIEVTKFKAMSRGHANDTARRLGVGLSISRFRVETPRMTREEMEHAVLSPSMGLIDWQPIKDPNEVDHFIDIVDEKFHKILENPTLETTDNWLLICDEHMMMEDSVTYLTSNAWRHLGEHWQGSPSFSRILFLSNHILVELTNTGVLRTNI